MCTHDRQRTGRSRFCCRTASWVADRLWHFGQGNELLIVAWDEREAPFCPVVARLGDALARRGDEVPPDVARSIHRRSAGEHGPRATGRAQGRGVTGSQHDEMPGHERLAVE